MRHLADYTMSLSLTHTCTQTRCKQGNPEILMCPHPNSHSAQGEFSHLKVKCKLSSKLPCNAWAEANQNELWSYFGLDVYELHSCLFFRGIVRKVDAGLEKLMQQQPWSSEFDNTTSLYWFFQGINGSKRSSAAPGCLNHWHGEIKELAHRPQVQGTGRRLNQSLCVKFLLLIFLVREPKGSVKSPFEKRNNFPSYSP